MSIFNELLPKIIDISKTSVKNFNEELKAAFECFDKFEEEYKNGRNGTREKAQRDKILTTTLQSINEDDDEPTKAPESIAKDNDSKSSTESSKRRVSKKRSKDEVEGMSSPELDKRQKRNASVKAQSIISKQDKDMLKELNENGVVLVSYSNKVNVNLTQKMRREDSVEQPRGRRRRDEDKENALPIIQIKQEKISLPPEPMDMESLPVSIAVKSESNKDDIAMPPPAAPVPKPRKGLQKERSEESGEEDAGSGRRRTKTRKQTDTMPPPPVPSARSTRASSRASSRAKPADGDPGPEAEDLPPPEPRPKRTRAKKKISDTASSESGKDSQVSQNEGGSPAEKPRPKRTRRGQKAAEKEAEKAELQPEKQKSEEKQPDIVSPKEERISQPDVNSPVLQKELKPKKDTKKLQKQDSDEIKTKKGRPKKDKQTCDEIDSQTILDETETTHVKLNDMDKTMVLTNGIYNHAPVTPKSICNETVVLETFSRETMVLDKQRNSIMDATVVLERVDPIVTNLTDDNSLLTDDSDSLTPPKPPPMQQPTSAVKEKVQQFEELAARTTRTKTRAMAKMLQEEQDNTPPDKMLKPVLSAETLTKMNNMIFNGKAPQISSSASKPRAIPVPTRQPASTSKLSAVQRHREIADETLKREREDARKKKEALLEAKREQQRKKREEKMAAAAAAREAAERERRLALEAAARGRMEKQAHADLGKLERLREVERKKQELARKVAETEERRRAEEQARQQRLAEDQKRADAARRKQLEEAEANKKEAAMMAKEIEKRQKEYIEKQKLKHRLENDKIHTPLKTPGTPGYHPQEPVYMADGFQHLNSDDEDERSQRPVPAWSSSKVRKLTLQVQSWASDALIDRLFSVRVHSPDLREIFPAIERARLKRTSSAVWRTPLREGADV